MHMNLCVCVSAHAHMHKLVSGFSKANECKYSGSGVSSSSRRDAHIAQKKELDSALRSLDGGKVQDTRGEGGEERKRWG